MWMCDLEKAIARFKEECDYNFICIEKISPCGDGGIVFALSDGSYVKWFPDGKIIRRRKDPQPTPRLPSNSSLGGQMVRKMIEAYEGRMNNG